MKTLVLTGGDSRVVAALASASLLKVFEGYALVDLDGQSMTVPEPYTVVEADVGDVPPGAHYIGGRIVVPEPVERPVTAEEREAKREGAREKRKAVEAAGTTLNGVPLSTDDKSLTKSTGAVSLFREDPTLTKIDFEAKPGLWVGLDAEQMRAVAVKIGRHVQTCFSHARALDELIVAADTRAEFEAIDINEGWPS